MASKRRKARRMRRGHAPIPERQSELGRGRRSSSSVPDSKEEPSPEAVLGRRPLRRYFFGKE